MAMACGLNQISQKILEKKKKISFCLFQKVEVRIWQDFQQQLRKNTTVCKLCIEAKAQKKSRLPGRTDPMGGGRSKENAVVCVKNGQGWLIFSFSFTG